MDREAWGTTVPGVTKSRTQLSNQAQHSTARDYAGIHGSSTVKNPLANAGGLGSIPGSGRPPGEGNGNPLQYSCLGNLMDRAA